MLVILDELSLRTYGVKTNISNRFCKDFGLHNDEKIHAYLMKLFNINNSDPGFSYGAVMNSQRYIIYSGITPPHQFSLGNLSTMIGITDSIGEGWDTRKVSKYFNKENNIANQQQEVPMTTSKHFEKGHIIFSRMKEMKFTMLKGSRKLFTIECYTASSQPQNISVCKQHAQMFKNDNYTFNPNKDLLLSMPYQFVAGKFTLLDNQ